MTDIVEEMKKTALQKLRERVAATPNLTVAGIVALVDEAVADEERTHRVMSGFRLTMARREVSRLEREVSERL